jgi:hypothetical protein
MRYPINTLTSNAIDTLSVNPITGTVRVRFLRYPTVHPYALKASRRAILSLLWNSDQSVGQWVNRHCLAKSAALDPLY